MCSHNYLDLGGAGGEEYDGDIRAVDFDGTREFDNSWMFAFAIRVGIYEAFEYGTLKGLQFGGPWIWN